MHDAGQFYWGRSDAWLDNRKIFDHWSTIVQLPRWQVQDIDTPDDWVTAEVLQAAIERRQKFNVDSKSHLQNQ